MRHTFDCRALLAGGIALLSLAGAAQAEGMKYREHRTCYRAGGEATMVTRDLAEFMAKAALGHSIEHLGEGYKAAGPVMLECNAPNPLTYCRARQRACR